MPVFLNWLCNLQGTMNLGLWHITSAIMAVGITLSLNYYPQSSLLGLCPWGTLLWLSCDSEHCGNPFVTAALGFQVWTPSCEPSMWFSPTVLMKSVLGESSNRNFPFSAFRAAIPWWVLRPEQHHHGLCSQLKSIYSELPEEVTGMQLSSLGLSNMAWRLHTADTFSGYRLGIPSSGN